MTRADDNRLTTPAEWDEYWGIHVTLPIEIQPKEAGPQADAILELLDGFTSIGATVLEIGGAPGQYLAHVYRHTGGRCAVLDSSPAGCDLTAKNFEALGFPVEIYERDMFDRTLDIGKFDVVYSLGLVEHFSDTSEAVEAHTRFVKPGGTLIIGMPNLRGVNGWFAKRINPGRLATHNLDGMHLATWDQFEEQLGLDRLYRGFVGGFEPRVFAVWEGSAAFRELPLRIASNALVRTFGHHFLSLRRFNHALFSGYLIGAWTVRRQSE